MDPVTISALIMLIGKVVEMSDNWNNPNYKPPSSDELKALAAQLEALPDLPTE